jgi:NAD(P)-dependent dehydrogenase (short-subunit alcohol dehydrogenase family)
MSPPLAGAVAVVSGGTSGIGRATVRALAQAGASVGVLGRNPERIEAVVAETGGAVGLRCDVRDETAVGDAIEQLAERFGRLDVVVACAGVAQREAGAGVPRPVSALAPALWRDVLDTNLTGTFLLDRAALPLLVRSGGGEIVNVSSFPAGIRGQPFAAAYSASKCAVVGLSEALAGEAAPLGVRVQVVYPGLVDTPLVSGTTLVRSFGPALPAERVAQLILDLVTLPRDATSLSARRLGAPVLRHVQAPHLVMLP